jgi:hypothetical protein
MKQGPFGTTDGTLTNLCPSERKWPTPVLWQRSITAENKSAPTIESYGYDFWCFVKCVPANQPKSIMHNVLDAVITHWP